MPVTVRADATVIASHVKGCTVVVEQARGPSYFGETGQRLEFWNLFSLHGKSPLAQADTAAELQQWAKKQGAKRAEIID